MVITLTADQEARLNALVASGDFASVEEAARALLDESFAELGRAEDDDIAWAKPLVDEPRAAIARREVITLDEHRLRNAERLAALRK